MKKSLFILLFIPFISFSQNDFREMNWGESSKILKEKYSETSFQSEVLDEDITVFSHIETVSGIDTRVVYFFTSDKFYTGIYLFEYNSYSRQDTDYLKDYLNVSARLNKKYDMNREDIWINDSYKKRPNELAFALSMSHVTLIQIGTNNDTLIEHSLERRENKFIHKLSYSSATMMKKIQESTDDKF
tara:strand:- start:116 stop:676 length:561 start_codon:yes stop_codon:yes gene_type:complete